MSLNKEQQQILLRLALKSIKSGYKNGHPYSVDLRDFDTQLREIRATFVTLEKNNLLRGCIGMLEARLPMVEDVCENAYSAAYKDPRFPPIQKNEIDQLRIKISILSQPEQLPISSEQDLIAQMRPGIDGLILEDDHHRGTFLPSVWETLPDKHDFLYHLKNKAGLPANYWSKNIRIYRYVAEMFG